MAKQTFPPQEQERQPGIESEMHPRPIEDNPDYRGSGKLEGRGALVTGGDSGIGRSIALHFAREGADVSIVYLNEHDDARRAKELVEREGRRCLLLPGDLGEEAFCREAVAQTVETLGGLDVLVNHAGEQHHRGHEHPLRDVTAESMERTFRTNIFSMFYLTKAALEPMGEGGTIVNTTSVTAYAGSPHLIDYSATKGAIVAFTRSAAKALAEDGIRVNGVAPGPVWTPLIPASFPAEEVKEFGAEYPLGPAHPYQIAPSYVFLACADSSNMTGQVLHPNSGVITES